MIAKYFSTPLGNIRYWTNEFENDRKTLVFLAGLTADHRLWERQIEFFRHLYNVLVWDAPAHGESRPFRLEFSLGDKARWLHEILKVEKIERPIFVGQSMGGYVSQCFMQQFPGELAGFVSIDSAPLQRHYYTKFELWLLKRMEPIYRLYPWKILVDAGSNGCTETDYGRSVMRAMMSSFSHAEYTRLAAHGYRILADAVEANLPYKINCPTLLICGEKDKAGSTKRYNKCWTKAEGFEIYWVPNAGHNSNTDDPQSVNLYIESFIENL